VGYEVYLRDGSKGDALWERIMDAGRPHGMRPTGPSDIRRVEAGILNYGIDMTLDNNPYEVGLGWLVEEAKEADYIGKAALKRIKAEGVQRKLVGVEIEGDALDFNMTRWPVACDGRPVGFVTSALYSPRLGRNIGYANVPADLGALGTHLRVDVPEVGEREAVVVAKPFVDPNKDIPKS
jgi:glycine cleavage system aminomethyltransferase T